MTRIKNYLFYSYIEITILIVAILLLGGINTADLSRHTIVK